MKAKIYRGTKEIGGTCVELTAENGKILWVDLGAPLDDKNPDIGYANKKVDALLISHPHQDHFGLMEKVGVDVPIYIGELAYDFINTTKLFIGLPLLKGNHKKNKPWQTFTIAGTFKIESFLTDHSTPESFSFIIEADGKRVFYSGDFRATGRKKIVFDKIIEAPPKDIDLLLIEGTMVERANHIYLTEESVEEGIYNVIKKQKNISFVISSAQNIDRLVSIIRACKKSGKKVVIDVYTSWLLDMLHKQSGNVPTMEWEEIRVFDHPGQMERITEKSFDEFRARIQTNRIGPDIFKKPSDFIYFVRNPNMKLVDKLRKYGKINIIYSQWEGYLKEDHKQYFTDNINALKVDKDIVYHSIHTSGHATIPDLMKFAKAINSNKIIPIHTAFPEKFKQEFEKNGFSNVNLWEDGIDYLI
ncbi:ribonuclease J [Daejeonella rubra]|uniref:Ribonuclease J n=1 Tax=Daejeonella rubra TaxID=990371 RepID=A0A1G9XVP4_9SPHI|nr:MBL fold metallo-hydrolase [Daejeonella rubra]SDN00303.1 ribonuclease J [Daejeonella rubra]